MNYNQKKIKTVNDSTGEISTSTVISEHFTGKRIRSLSMGVISLQELFNVQDSLGHKKNSLIVLEYILKNLDANNVFRANISEISKTLKITNRSSIRDTLSKLNKYGFMVSLGKEHIYQINPFIYITTKVKRKEEKITLQSEFEKKYPNQVNKLSFKVVEQYEYLTYLKSNTWKNKQSRLFSERKECALCGDKNNLHLHHLTYTNLYNENDKDLEVLCGQCHRRIHLATREL